jgi:methylamine dehydrogenase accessory protein MauD
VSLSGDAARNREFVARHRLERIPFIISEDLGFQYNVLSPPYAILLDERRIIRAKGVANHLEHLESLINAAQLGYPSMESWAQAQRASHEGAPV